MRKSYSRPLVQVCRVDLEVGRPPAALPPPRGLVLARGRVSASVSVAGVSVLMREGATIGPAEGVVEQHLVAARACQLNKTWK
jgi:hypothetical protein